MAYFGTELQIADKKRKNHEKKKLDKTLNIRKMTRFWKEAKLNIACIVQIYKNDSRITLKFFYAKKNGSEKLVLLEKWKELKNMAILQRQNSQKLLTFVVKFKAPKA